MNDKRQADPDPEETQEWLDALTSVLETQGVQRVQYLLQKLSVKLTETGTQLPYAITTPYRNTIPVHQEARMPGDLFMERSIRSLIRWNAMAMVIRANLKDGTLGGHISTFQSSATLYDVGFNYFFRANTAEAMGDLLYIQGHSAPGIYARSFLEGRFSEAQLDQFRQEVDGNGLSSYPHPWLMPDYWQFPRTGPSRRCRLQFTTKIRLSSFSRPAKDIAPRDSGSSISPSPTKHHTLRSPGVASSRLPKYFMICA